MANTKKRVLSFLMAMVMVVGLLPLNALAAGDAKAEQAQKQIVEAGGVSYYKADGTQTTKQNADVAVSKTVTATGTENLFDVTVNVQYKKTTTSVGKSAYVVLVLDTSGSMGYCSECGAGYIEEDGTGTFDRPAHCKKCGRSRDDGNHGWLFGHTYVECTETLSRMDAAKAAANAFLDGLAREGTTRYVSLVTFESDAAAKDFGRGTYWLDVSQGSNLQTVKDAVNALSPNGGTNTEGGMQLAYNLLKKNTAAVDARYVVLLSDGEPTFHLNGNRNDTNAMSFEGSEGGGDRASYNDWKDLKGIADKITAVNDGNADMYSLLYGDTGSATCYGDRNHANTTVKALFESFNPRPATGNILQPTNANQLKDMFEGILQRTQESGASSTGMSDAGAVLETVATKAAHFWRFVRQNGAQNSGDNITWDFINNGEKDAAASMGEGFTSYTMSYQIWLDTTVQDFVEGTAYELSPASVTFRDAADPNGEIHTAVTPTAKIKGYRAELSFEKVAHEDGHLLGNATFTASNLAWTDGQNGTIKAAGAWSYDATSGIDPEDKATYGKVIFPENSIPSGYGFTLKETAAPAGYELDTTERTFRVVYGEVVEMEPAIENGKIENTLQQQDLDLTVKKQWRTPDDVSDKTIEVTLYQDRSFKADGSVDNAGSVYAVLQLRAGQAEKISGDGRVEVKSATVNGKDWTYVLTVDALNVETGSRHTYAVEETAVSGFDTTYDQSTLTIVNTAAGTTSVSVQKQWILPDGLVGQDVKVILYKDGKKFKSETVKGDGTVYTFEDLPLYNESYTAKAHYTVGEDPASLGTGYQYLRTEGSGDAGDPYVFVNSVADENRTVSGTKTWKTPVGFETPTITVQLFKADANGQPTGTALAELELDGKADSPADGNAETTPWTFRFTQDAEGNPLPKYDFEKDDSNKITGVTENRYVVVEEGADNGQITLGGNTYTVSRNGNDITNVLTGETSVTVTKTWVDLDGAEKPEVTVKLLRNGEVVGKKTLENDKAEWTGLDRYDENGWEYSYTVEEVVPAGYELTKQETKQLSDGSFQAELVNRRKIDDKKISVTVTKTWQQPGTVTAPDVVFTLFADGVEKGPKTLRAGEGSLTFENLPRYKYVTVEETDGKGKVTGTHQEIEEIEYTVTEATPSGYNSVSSNETDAENGNVSYRFTNTITGEVTLEVEKNWIDAVHTGTQPEATFKVYRVSADHARELVGTYTTTDSKWSGSFDRYDEKGQLYTYTVEELSVPGYESTVRQAAPDTEGSYIYQMTNTLNQAEIGHTVTKHWVDGGKKDRPDIELTLQQSEDGVTWHEYRDADGKKVTHTLPNGETQYTFENLPQYNDDRTAAYQYRVVEAPVKDYDTTYTYGAGTQITNTLKQDYTKVSISKTWVDPTGTEHPNVTFNLLANGSVVQTVKLGFRDGATAPTNEGASLTSNTWEYTFTNLPVYDAQRNPITYTVEEESVPGYTSAKSGDGHTFTNTIEQDTIPFTGTKTWSIPAPAKGAVDQADAVINTIWVGLYKGQTGSAVLVDTPREVDAKNEDGKTYSFTFENLDKYDLTTGEEIRYFVREGKMENGTFVPYADQATFLVPDGGIHADYDDTYQVTYPDAKSITNTYQAPVRYYYQIVRNYKTTFGDGHTEVYTAKVDGAIETGIMGQTVTADPRQYTTQDGVKFTFVNADPADYTVTLDEANHLYVITLNYERDLHQLTVEYQFEGYHENGATVPAGFETIRTPKTPVRGDGYTDPGRFNPKEKFATQAVPDRAAVPAGYVLTKVTANGAEQDLGDYSGAFGTVDDFCDIHVIYTYAKRSGSHPDIPASVTLSKYDNASVPALITASAATFQLYSDETCTEAISGKTYTTSNGKLTITASDEGLGAGTYYLKELTAPEGYDLSEEVFKLTVSVIPHQEWYEDTAQGGRVWVIYDEFRLKVEKKTDTGYKAVSAIDVTDALKTADYTVKYWFEQSPAAEDYRQLPEYPNLTGTLGYFDTVLAAKYELGNTGMKGIPEGYEWDHNTPDSISYDSADKIINLYYDLKISTDKQNVSVTKTWYGTAGSAEIGLYQTVNGIEKLVDHQTVTGNASYTFENFPKYVDGHEASYEIFEIVGSDAEGWTKVAEGAKVTLNGVDYQVRYTGSGLNESVINSELGSVTVTKVFADVEGGGISYPASVEAMLYADGQQVLQDALGNAVGNAKGVLTVANNGTVYSVTVRDLPKYDAQGKAITYTVQECYTNPTTSTVQPVNDGAKITLDGVEYTVTYQGTGITNTVARGELTVVKTYTGPAELSDAFQVLVKENGQTVATLTKADAARTGTGTDSDPYTYTWTVRNLLSGRTYTVEEAGTAVEGWTLKSAESTVSVEHVSTGETAALHNVYERNQAYLTITKTVSGLKMNEKHSFKFQVTGNNYGTDYNETHTIEVTGNTSASTTIQVPTGSYTVTELADSAAIGSYQLTATTYTPANNGGTAAEISVTDANHTPAQAAAVTVSNVYSYDPPSGSQVTITVRKVWEDDHNRDGLRPVSITVGLFEDGKLMEGVVNTKVVPVGTGDTDTVSFTYDAYLHPGKIVVRELGYTVGEGYVDANGQPVEAGYHEGALAGYKVIYADPTSEGVCTITNVHQSEEIRIPVVKTWSGSYGTQPSKIELELYANGKATGLKLELTAQDAIGTDTRRWYGVFASQKEGTEPIRIYKNENGKAIVYTVVELSIDGVTVTGNSCGSWVVSTGTTTAGTILKTEEERALLANRLGIAIQEETTLLSVSNYFSSGGSDPDPDKPKPNPDPDPDPGTDIDNPDVPLDPGPGGDDVNIDDEDVPTTGDNFGMWVAAASVSGMALIWLALTGKKRKEDDAQN